jgi:hypothetical protein
MLLVALVVDLPAIVVERAVEAILLALRQVAIMPGLIGALALLDICVMPFIARFLLAVDPTIRHPGLDAILLILQMVIHLVDPWMVGNIGRIGQRRSGDDGRGLQQTGQNELNFDV